MQITMHRVVSFLLRNKFVLAFYRVLEYAQSSSIDLKPGTKRAIDFRRRESKAGCPIRLIGTLTALE